MPDKNNAELRRLAGQIARLPDIDPPPGLTAAVMQRIVPKRPSRRVRFQRWLRFPLAFIPVRVVPAAGACLLLLVGIATLIKGFGVSMPVPDGSPPLAMGGQQAVLFRLDHPTAHSVAVIGTFNHWNPEGYRMHRAAPQGPWQLRIDLTTGQYAYAFLIDDKWVVPDPHALWQQADGFGNFNSTLIVANGRQHANDI